MVRSPVDICFGTSPSQAPKSRPLENAAPLPIALPISLEMIGPMPGTVISRSHAGSPQASAPISLDRTSMRSSSRCQSSASPSMRCSMRGDRTSVRLASMRRGLRKPGSGRNGLTPNQVLRSLVLMRVKNWDYRELRERIADGLTLRQFTDFYCAPVPKHDAFQRGIIRLTPRTLKAVNDLVARAAVKLGLEDGAKLRVDTTVGQPDIPHPTDSTLLWDVVRVLTRL